MKNTRDDKTDPYASSRPLGGIDVPCTDPGAMDCYIPEDTDSQAKVRREHELRRIQEAAFKKAREVYLENND